MEEVAADDAAPALRWARRDDVLWRSTPYAVVALPADADEPFVLAGSGASLWDALDEPRTVAEVAALLAERYDAPAAVIAADLVPVIDELESRRVVAAVP